MERIAASLRDKIKSVEEAAALIQSGSVIGCSGFTLVGEPKAVPHELARQKKADHLTILTGASVGDALDGEADQSGSAVHGRIPIRATSPCATPSMRAKWATPICI